MRTIYLFLLINLFAALVSVNGMKNADIKVLEISEHVNEALQTFYPVNVVKLNPSSRSDGSNRAVGTKCSEQVTLLQAALGNGSLWALQMVDASSKIPSGILMGNRQDLGMFDECMSISVNESGQEIRGRHCMYSVVIGLGGLPISETLSICLPASCESEDVHSILTSLLELVGNQFPVDIPISIGTATCSAIEPPEWTTGGILTLTGFSMLLLFLVICTGCDIFAMYSSEKPLPNSRLDIYRQFSFYSNAVRLLNTKTSPQTLPALQGLRFYSMCWVIIGHAHIMFFVGSVNLLEMFQWIMKWDAVYVIIAPFAVDSFFTMSGFLMSYLFLKEISSGRSFNIFAYYLHRYLRLTPALIAVILITIFIAPRLGSGPLWDGMADAEAKSCTNSWWTMVLYVQNYVTGHDIQQACLGHTWYLAVEMHFFWISPLILYPLAKKPKIGLIILAACIVASIATPVKIGYDNKYSTAMIGNRVLTGIADFMKKFYLASHVRAAPWLIGVFFGYLIYTQKGTTASKATKRIGWICAIVAFAFCVFTIKIFQNEDYEYDEVWEAFYTALARPLWAFGVSWIMYASIRGFGGPVATFLSYPIYTPLSRISYCIYLVHFEIQYLKIRSARTLNYFSSFNAFDRFLSDFLLSIMVGFLFTLIFESPVLVLEKILKNRSTRTRDHTGKKIKDNEMENGIEKSSHLTSS